VLEHEPLCPGPNEILIAIMFIGMVLASMTHGSLTKLVGTNNDESSTDPEYQRYDIIGYCGLGLIWVAMTIPFVNLYSFFKLRNKIKAESIVTYVNDFSCRVHASDGIAYQHSDMLCMSICVMFAVGQLCVQYDPVFVCDGGGLPPPIYLLVGGWAVYCFVIVVTGSCR
jgi:hypothetical protein